MATAKQLEIMGIAGWIGVALAVVGAYYGSRFGLAGIVYGVSIGWILRLIVAIVLVRQYFVAAPKFATADSKSATP